MYTIGQVAKFLNVSRDTLKFYEEKELVKPKQNIENGYIIWRIKFILILIHYVIVRNREMSKWPLFLFVLKILAAMKLL